MKTLSSALCATIVVFSLSSESTAFLDSRALNQRQSKSVRLKTMESGFEIGNGHDRDTKSRPRTDVLSDAESYVEVFKLPNVFRRGVRR